MTQFDQTIKSAYSRGNRAKESESSFKSPCTCMQKSCKPTVETEAQMCGRMLDEVLVFKHEIRLHTVYVVSLSLCLVIIYCVKNQIVHNTTVL